jgi:hypothetical protein
VQTSAAVAIAESGERMVATCGFRRSAKTNFLLRSR